ncbi:MAG: RNA-binding S4 domain-containing protein [Candidatus Omnitrophica bacterium]|nr:RNA-binding S4 domain-containing protein [Candidatus Omnitrophota bacterium]MDD5574341.1 RNA-binding S4 domain-containing protein [Candidatus Omnitrophota bacterium]
MEFALRGDYIELDNLLKASGIAASGAEARDLIRQGRIFVNNEKESRLRRKVRKGDKVSSGRMLLEVI